MDRLLVTAPDSRDSFARREAETPLVAPSRFAVPAFALEKQFGKRITPHAGWRCTARSMGGRPPARLQRVLPQDMFWHSSCWFSRCREFASSSGWTALAVPATVLTTVPAICPFSRQIGRLCGSRATKSVTPVSHCRSAASSLHRLQHTVPPGGVAGFRRP